MSLKALQSVNWFGPRLESQGKELRLLNRQWNSSLVFISTYRSKLLMEFYQPLLKLESLLYCINGKVGTWKVTFIIFLERFLYPCTTIGVVWSLSCEKRSCWSTMCKWKMKCKSFLTNETNNVCFHLDALFYFSHLFFLFQGQSYGGCLFKIKRIANIQHRW